MDIAVSTLQWCCGDPLAWAWDEVKKQCLYCIKYKENAEAFESDATEFLEKVQRLEEAVQRSGRHSIRGELQRQLGKSTDVKNKVNVLTSDMETATSTGCISNYKLSKRIVKLRKAMMQLLQDPEFISAVSLQPQAIRPPSRVKRPDDFLYFTSRKPTMDEIMNALKDEGRSIVRVYGMGGVGKTYMVKALASRALKEKKFDRVVESVVSQTVDLRKIQGDIAHGLGVELTSTEVQDRADDLRNLFNDHGNILLILDGLWETINLSTIGIPQYSERCKCKILITTRQMNVCDDLDRQYSAIQINVLSGDDPWTLFTQKAGDNLKVPPGFEEIGKKIVEECRGLPIALSTIGSALYKKDLTYWETAATRLHSSKTASIKEDDLNSVIRKCIELSYSFLPNDTCKRVFLMCSIFPEDYNIPKETLTRYVMGLALIRGIETVKEARGDIHQIVEELKAASLLLDGDKEETVKMHDVIRDISIQIGYNQEKPKSIVKASMKLENWPGEILTNSCGAISLISNHLKKLPDRVDCPETEILLLQDNKNLRLVPDEFFQGMRALKVLDFTGVKFKSLPSSTRQLSLLRLLSLDNCRFLKDVSMIGELNRLEILTLRMSGITSLPESFANLKELRILDITLSLQCENVPPGVISSMDKLEELYMQGCFADWEITNENRKTNFQEILTLGSLTILKVDIKNVCCLPPDSVAPNWEKFDICVSDSEECRLANAAQQASFTRGLTTGVNLEAFPEWFRQAVSHKAEKLSYQFCGNLSNILQEYLYGNFDEVKSLYIDQCADIAQLIKLGNGLPNQPVFPKLEKLNIHHMQKTEGICTEELPPGSLQQVKMVEVSECPKLKDSLLPPNLIQRMSNLEEVKVTGTSINAVFGFDGITFQGGQLRKLKRLTLLNLSQLTSLWKGPSELVMFHRLEVVKVSQRENLRYIFPYTVCDYLCHLQVLWLEDCSGLEKVIGGHTDENGVHEVPESITLPRLTTLTLQRLPHLTDFYTQEAYLRCPELQRLHKQDCKRLRTNLSDYHSDQEIQEKSS
uniref:CC-NB-LRR protein n=1 Tax=Solanum tuberosum TaxID=4113 RepID=Q75VK7_SOLTU|nr:CC-NB-LRR protein [Solanum tuberosum]